MAMDDRYQDQSVGSSTTVLLGADNGKYPDANAMLVRGTERTVLIDPALGILPRVSRLPPIDAVLLTHAHEDHLPGLHRFPDAECWVHEADRFAMQSLDDFIDLFGIPDERRTAFAQMVTETYHYVPRPDSRGFEDGHVWELGDSIQIEAIHAPGHTAGHTMFLVQPDSVLFLGDVDLSSFGPFYGDAFADIDDFERTIERARTIDARTYVSGHHKGIIHGRDEYLELLERYGAVIQRREQRLLDFLSAPRTLEQIAEHRLIYRPKDDGPGIANIERVVAERHLERLERAGRVSSARDGTYQATG